MKIVFTGGGTGGHFYPIVAVAEAVHEVVRDKKLVEPELYYMAPEPYNNEVLYANSVTFLKIPAGKLRHYFSLRNVTDGFKTLWGIVLSLWRLYFLYPDVVFGAGGYASFPPLVAARILGIPVVIYATDAQPSRVNKWAGKFAVKIAISFPDAAKFFPAEKFAFTENPVRKHLMLPAREGAYEFLKLDPTIPVVWILGGSQGAVAINDAILAGLPKLLEEYQVVHQTGEANITEVAGRAKIALEGSAYANRYKPFGYLNELALRMTAGAAKVAVCRSGAGTIFELATWGIPAILVPIPEEISHDQTKNALSYARTGAASIIEQRNLTPGVLLAEINRILQHQETARTMSQAARSFARADAGKVIAEALLSIALSHEV
ncbi:MAG: UDP-N-acetylglucosamine--N-acetylmuramyl-(pentapeptide) pyrophosphoryl-undecaprenol [Patescibacteria group bacterium]|nr:UDP-N-acetylglucosamine--N-acetylmuramyl-(pentapeptide) pyrophosphoryl-undecaprenol [Patescibacteria group bacterium]